MRVLSQVYSAVELHPGSRLRLRPNVIVPYSNSRHQSLTDVHFWGNAEALIAEMCLIPPSRLPDNLLPLKQLKTLFQVFRNGKLILRDPMQLGSDGLTAGKRWRTEQRVVASVYLVGHLDMISRTKSTLRGIVDEMTIEHLIVGVTAVDDAVIVVRMLANRVQDIEKVLLRVAYSFENPASR